MCRFVWLNILVGVFLFQNASHGAAQSIAGPRPELPYFDWNACPFEAGAYGKWTAREVVPLYGTWKKRRLEITRLAVGDKVVAVTGAVITFKPGLIRMDRDLPANDLKAGDTILTYAYRGEGFSSVWFKGRYYSDFDITFTKWPNERGGCGGDTARRRTLT
jgi:hypothetical protein